MGHFQTTCKAGALLAAMLLFGSCAATAADADDTCLQESSVRLVMSGLQLAWDYRYQEAHYVFQHVDELWRRGVRPGGIDIYEVRRSAAACGEWANPPPRPPDPAPGVVVDSYGPIEGGRLEGWSSQRMFDLWRRRGIEVFRPPEPRWLWERR